jgi:phosphatidylglycerophosphatase A
MNASNKRSLLSDPGHFLALGGGSGLLPKAPGTAGTLVGLVIFWPMAGLDKVAYLSVVTALFCVGIPLCRRTATVLGKHDHPAIVWDEIVGILVTLAFVCPSLQTSVIGFCLFRYCDIVKPWPISYLDRQVSGGLGIMLDDLVAAIFAGITLVFIEYLSYI